MNLRSKKTIPVRGKKKSNLLMLAVLYAVIIGFSFFAVFAYTIYLDGKSQEINKDIASKDQNIYILQREIKNLKIKLENFSRKEYIVSKIRNYNLKLRTPDDYQVISLSSKGIFPTLPKGEEVAFN